MIVVKDLSTWLYLIIILKEGNWKKYKVINVKLLNTNRLNKTFVVIVNKSIILTRE